MNNFISYLSTLKNLEPGTPEYEMAMAEIEKEKVREQDLENKRKEALGAIDATRRELNAKPSAMDALANIAKNKEKYRNIESPNRFNTGNFSTADIQKSPLPESVKTATLSANAVSPTGAYNGPSIRLDHSLGDTTKLAKQQPEQIYDEKGLTGRYSEVPEAQNYMKSRRPIDEQQKAKESFSKNISPDFFNDEDKKKQLFNAYIEMGDKESAKDLMNSVVSKKVESPYGRSNLGLDMQLAKMPEFVQKVQDNINMAEDQGMSPELADLYRTNADVAPYSTNSKVTAFMESPERKVRDFKATSDLRVSQAGKEAAAGTSGREKTQRQIQIDQPILNKSQSDAIKDSYMGINYLHDLKDALNTGKIDYFAVSKTGEITNPKVRNAINQLVEIVGRDRSGAAISTQEWSNFKNEVLNPRNLLTDEGQKVAKQTIEDYLDKFSGAGTSVAGDEDWYTNYQGKIKKSRENIDQGRQQKQPGGGGYEAIYNTPEEAEKNGKKGQTVRYRSNGKIITAVIE